MSVLMILAMLHTTPLVVSARRDHSGADAILKAVDVENNTATTESWPEGALVYEQTFEVATTCSCFIEFSVKQDSFLAIVPGFEKGGAEILPDTGAILPAGQKSFPDVHIWKYKYAAPTTEGNDEEWFENIVQRRHRSLSARREDITASLSYNVKMSKFEGLELRCDYDLRKKPGSGGKERDRCIVERRATILKGNTGQGMLMKTAGQFMLNAENKNMVDLMNGYGSEGLRGFGAKCE